MITQIGKPFSEDFTGFTGAGLAPTPAAGQLDSDDWRVTGLSDGVGTFGGTHVGGDFARGISAGGVSTGGIYGFDVGNQGLLNRALGIQPAGGDFTPGQLTLRLENLVGSPITELKISYDIYVFNDQPRSNLFNFSYSLDDATYVDVPSAGFASPSAADASPMWLRTGRSVALTGLSIPSGSLLYLRWTGDDVSGTGSRDEFALDNVSVTATPEPSALALWSTLLVLLIGLLGGRDGGMALLRRQLAGRRQAHNAA